MCPAQNSLLETVVLPLASPDDAETTCEALTPYLVDGGRVIALHVIEKAGGAPDKASVEQREGRAEEIFEIVTDRFAEAGIDVETQLLYGTDVAQTIIDAAAERDASAIVITPRTASRWRRLLTGDTALSLMTNTDRPLVVVPDPEDSG